MATLANLWIPAGMRVHSPIVDRWQLLDTLLASSLVLVILSLVLKGIGAVSIIEHETVFFLTSLIGTTLYFAIFIVSLREVFVRYPPGRRSGWIATIVLLHVVGAIIYWVVTRMGWDRRTTA